MAQVLERSCSLGLPVPRAFWRWLFWGAAVAPPHRVTQGQPLI